MVTQEQQRKALAKRIEELRIERGSTKRHLLQASGLHLRTYNRRIAGVSDFTFTELIAIASALGVTVADLIETAADADAA